MKLRHPWLLKAAAMAGSWTLCGWMRTLRYDYRPIGASVDPAQGSLEGRFIYAIWHENLLLPIYQYAAPDIYVLISQHADGQIVADICRHLKVQVIRGSTTRGGVEALRQLLRAGKNCHLAMTPDGPRGPRQRVKLGMIYLAARLGLPIVPVGFGFQKAWRFNSWDRFALPRPWTRATCVTGEPIVVPDSYDKDEIETYRLRVEDALTSANDTACNWAETGHWLSPEALKAIRGPHVPVAEPIPIRTPLEAPTDPDVKPLIERSAG